MKRSEISESELILNQLWLLQKIRPCTFLDSVSEIPMPLKMVNKNRRQLKLTVLYDQKIAHNRYHHSKIVQTCRQSLNSMSNP